jgi:uncharacterized sulfatase
MQFNDAYVAAPVCSPARASIISGQYPARVGITDYIVGHWWPFEKMVVPTNKTQYLPLKLNTLGKILKNTGYRTGYFGKWHLGGSEYYPDKQGFDESVVYEGGGYYDSNLVPDQNASSSVRLSEVLTDLSLDFIEQNKEKPFFLFLSHFDVHVQLDADSLLIQKYLKKDEQDGYPSNAIYAAMIEHLDNSVGRIVKKIEELDISDDTMLVFYSDNGGLIRRGDKGPLIAKSKSHIYREDVLQYLATSNAPLRNEKGTLYEGGIRVPFIVKWPGKVKAGLKSEIPITSVDILPTLVDVGGGELPSNQIYDGKSILPVLTDNNYNNLRPLFWHYPHYHHDKPSGAVRLGKYKLIEFYDDSHLELYNLEEDVGEKNNLLDEMPSKANQLWSLLYNWRLSVNAEMPVPNPDFNPEIQEVMGIHPDVKK